MSEAKWAEKVKGTFFTATINGMLCSVVRDKGAGRKPQYWTAEVFIGDTMWYSRWVTKTDAAEACERMARWRDER